MRRRGLETPVIIFASRYNINRPKGLALSLGAQDSASSFEALLRAIERIFAPGRGNRVTGCCVGDRGRRGSGWTFARRIANMSMFTRRRTTLERTPGKQV
jgi:hypothetical protein